jgi:hypothetical protein
VTWGGYDPHKPLHGAEGDDGVLIIKSGADFRDLSEIQLELEESPPGSVRRRYISTLHGKYMRTRTPVANIWQVLDIALSQTPSHPKRSPHS